jgi:hypothetical protein
MRVYTRHFFGLFFERCLVVFLFLQVFLSLCNLLAVLPHAPQIPFKDIMLAAPDLLLLVLPLSVSLSVIVGCGLFFEAVDRQRGFFWIELAGHDPRRYLAGLMVFGLVCSAGLWLLNNYILPKTRFYVDYVLTRPRDTTASLALRLATQPNLFSGYHLDFQIEPPARLTEFTLTGGADRPLLISAPQAGLGLTENEQYLELTMQNGRILRLDDHGRLTENAHFERLSFAADVNRLFGASKTEVLKPRYYTQREFARLPELLEYRSKLGLLPTKRQKRNLAAIDPVRGVRLQEALNPSLYIGVFLLLAGTHAKDNGRRRVMLAAGLCLFVLLPQQVLFQTLADRDRLGWAGWALLPTAETLALLAIGAARWGWGRRS